MTDKQLDRLTKALIEIALNDYSAAKCAKVAMKALRWYIVKPKPKRR